MGTVGLSFGSATSGQGFDVSTTVTSILAIQQAIETPWKNQLTSLQSQATAFTTLGTDLSNLSTSLQSLTDFEGVLAQKDGSSSNTDVIALGSASSTAVAGSHQITVSQLAQTSSVYSNAVASTDTLSGSITIQIGSGSAQTINVGSSSNTVSTLASAINAAGIGVTASVISDANGQRLSLVSGTSGAGGQLTVTSGLNDDTTSSAMTTQVGQNGQNALLNVDGISVSSASNTVTSAIPGVTFQALSTSTSPVQVTISNDTASIATAMNSFVTAYNQLVKDMTTQEGKDSSGKPEPLYGDPTLAMLQSGMTQGLLGGSSSGSISSLSQLGVTVNQDGTLTFSQSDFTDAVNSNFSDVVGYLQNSGSFGSNFTNVLNGLSSTETSGALYLAQQQITNEETDLNNNISNEETLLATEKTTLTTELNTANEELQAIPQQLGEVNEMYGAITGYNQSK